MLPWLPFACHRAPEPSAGDGEPEADADTDTDTDTDTPAEPVTHLRFVHVAAEVGAVDVRLDDGAPPALAGVRPPAGTAFRELPAGDHRIAVSAADGPELASGAGALRAGAHTAAVFYGSPEAAALALLDEGLDDVPLGRARYTLFHAAPGLPPVDAVTPVGRITAEFGARADLGVGDGVETTFALDLDRDGAAECVVTVPAVGPDARAAAYLVVHGGQARVYGQARRGGLLALRTDPEACPVPGFVPDDSGDTGGRDTGGRDTGSRHTGSPDTGTGPTPGGSGAPQDPTGGTGA